MVVHLHHVGGKRVAVGVHQICLLIGVEVAAGPKAGLAVDDTQGDGAVVVVHEACGDILQILGARVVARDGNLVAEGEGRACFEIGDGDGFFTDDLYHAAIGVGVIRVIGHIDLLYGERVDHRFKAADVVGMGVAHHKDVDFLHAHALQLSHHILAGGGVGTVHQHDLAVGGGVDGAVAGGDDIVLGGRILGEIQIPGGELAAVLGGVKHPGGVVAGCQLQVCIAGGLRSARCQKQRDRAQKSYIDPFLHIPFLQRKEQGAERDSAPCQGRLS